jgi:hypothetical protein
LDRKSLRIFLVLSALLMGLFWVLQGTSEAVGDLDWPANAEINGIRIENDEGIFIASRRGGEWTVSQPERGIGKTEALEDLIRMGSRIRVQGNYPNGERSHYGLNPPVVRLELRGGETGIQVAFGKKAPAHYASYIQVDNGPVLAVEGYPVETLLQPFRSLYAAQD